MTLVDLGNEQPTSVNGAVVDKRRVRVGDCIAVGKSRVVIETAQLRDEALYQRMRRSVAPAMNAFAASPRTAVFGVDDSRRTLRSGDALAPARDDSYRLVACGPPVPDHECELEGVAAVEVAVSWGTNTLHTAHLTPPRSFYVGEEVAKNVRCDFFLPADVIGTTRMPLVVEKDGRMAVVLPPGAVGFVESPDGGRVELSEAAKRAEPCAELSGAFQLPLPFGARAQIHVGEFTFTVAAVNAGKPLGAGLVLSGVKEMLPYLGLVAFMVFAVMGFAYYAMPPSSLQAYEGLDRDARVTIGEFMDLDAITEPEAVDPDEGDEADPDGGGEQGARAEKEEGASGKENSTETEGRMALKGPKDNPEVRLTKRELIEQAQAAPMIGLLLAMNSSTPNAPNAWLGDAVATGRDPLFADGNLWNDRFGESSGPGRGLMGNAQGGGGDSTGSVGLGDIGTIGRDLKYGTKGWTGKSLKRHKTRRPTITRDPDITASGRLPAEVIRRVVRRNHGRFRACYEKALSTDPSLEGRVAIRFVIGRDGAVSAVSNAGSDIPNSAVVQCVARAFHRLSFPSPEDGIVSVTYPLTFQPG